MATIALSGPTLVKAGKNVSTDLSVGDGSIVEHFIEQAESTINSITRHDFVTNWITFSGSA